MDAKEFGTALFNEYFINETHAVQIIETCYGGPTNWSYIEWTRDDTVTNNTTPGSNNWKALEHADGPPTDKAAEVLGMSIFWILLTLCLACVYHPLASSIHSLSRFRRYLHISPIFCFIDSVCLIIQCCVPHDAQDGMTWRQAIEVVVGHRLREFLSLPVAQGESGNEMRQLPTVGGTSGASSTASVTPEHQNALPESHSESTLEASSTGNMSSTLAGPTISGEQLAPPSVVARAALSAYVRIIANILIVLSYAKICGFSGIRPWSVLADLLFTSWLIMEAFLVIGYYAATRERLDADHSSYSSVLTQDSHDLTPAVEASVLTPLFVEVLVSVLALYYKAGGGEKVKSVCWYVAGFISLGFWEYLVYPTFTAAWNLPHPLWLPATTLALLPLIINLVIMDFAAIIAFAAFLAPPAGYTLGLYLAFGCVERLLTRHNHIVGTRSTTTFNLIKARVLVTIIYTHYIVYFLWFYDSMGTAKMSWTELLSRRLG